MPWLFDLIMGFLSTRILGAVPQTRKNQVAAVAYSLRHGIRHAAIKRGNRRAQTSQRCFIQLRSGPVFGSGPCCY
ncbi:hypothetical protein BKA80DRAFT_282162 [Phyllosticta citrichinensis]